MAGHRVLVFQKSADEGAGAPDDAPRSGAPALKGNYLISIDYVDGIAFGFRSAGFGFCCMRL
jgi:hypothetical protein